MQLMQNILDFDILNSINEPNTNIKAELAIPKLPNLLQFLVIVFGDLSSSNLLVVKMCTFLSALWGTHND